MTVLIDHITFSKTGGAGVVAQTIANAQSALGYDANVLTVLDTDLRSEPVSQPLLTLTAALDEWLVASRAQETLFSLLRGNLETLDLSRIRPDSVIHLHWMSGVMNHERVRGLLEAGRKVVWSLHDMNPFTGGCHHSHGCKGFQGSCSRCPQARSLFRTSVSLNLQRRSFGRNYPNLLIVCPTGWLSEHAENSSVFRGQKFQTVPNAIGDFFFNDTQPLTARRALGIPDDDFVAALIAKDLADPNKNIKFVLKGLEEASTRTKRPLSLLLIGRNGESYKSSLVNVRWIGELTSKKVSEFGCAADVLISGSIAESAGMTIIELAAMGVPSIALENGGTRSQIEDEKTGLLVRGSSDLASRVVSLSGDRERLAALGSAARSRSLLHRSDLVAARYIKIYESLG